MCLRIAICDDNGKDRAAIRAALDDYLRVRGVDAEVCEFGHPDGLLEASGRRGFELYLLDVMMPMVSGISVMREVRQRDRHAAVVYFSSSREYALEAFGVQAVNYLLKPWTRAAFNETMTRALERSARTAERELSLKTPDGVCRVPLDEIACVTTAAAHNFLAVRLMDGVVRETRLTMAAFHELIAGDDRFFLAGRAAVVNPHAVRSVDGTTVRLVVGEPIDIPRYCVQALKQAVLSL